MYVFCLDDSTGAAGVIFKNIFAVANSKKESNANSSMLTKPESCTIEQFVEERCPCIYNDPKVVICEGLNISRIPDDLLQPSLFKIKMSNNSITSIDNVQWPRSLSTLVLVNNSITHIGPRAFELAPSLKLLFLTHNEISHFDTNALAELNHLTWLQFEDNKLETFDSNALMHTPNIAKLYLSENRIDLPDSTEFSRCCQNLRELLLDHNRISLVRSHWFSNMTSLIWLSLSYNEISFIEDGSFDWNPSLEELNLSFNKIKVINKQIFAQDLGIKRLHLSGNPLKTLPKDAFRELRRLQSLNLTDIYFDQLHKETFAGLELSFIYFARFRYCHYVSHARVCLPLTDGLSSTKQLLVFPILQDAVRIVALVCCLGNVFVFVWRSVSPHEHYTLSLFVRNLSIADLMMGIYLAAIGYKDWQFKGDYQSHSIEWMASGACTAIGFIAIFSSELSVFILTIITIERHRSIISAKSVKEEDQKRRARVYLTLAWIFSFLIAAYPLIESLVLNNTDFYATNGLCLPLHIDQPFTPGWQYSAVVYLGINFAAVLIIICLYVRMYARIMQARQQACPFGAMKREDAILATRFFFIVITDCVCWIPIVIIKIMALADVSISSSVYGWLVVFIIPINSALNPIVYTLAAPTSMRAAIVNCFKWACDRFDKLTIRNACTSRYSSHSSHSSSSVESANSSNMIDFMGRSRRRNTGSTNSTTFDTFSTCMITGNSKPSVESALIHYECAAGGVTTGRHNLARGANTVRSSAIKALPTFDFQTTITATEHQESFEEDVEGQKTMPLRQGCSIEGQRGTKVAASLSSLDYECSRTASSGTNKAREPADISLNKLDTLGYRRRLYAASGATANSTSFSSNSTATTNSSTMGSSSYAESKLNNPAQADYLSTYEDNAANNAAITNGGGGGAPLLIDMMTCVDSTSSCSGSGQDQGNSPLLLLNDDSTNNRRQIRPKTDQRADAHSSSRRVLVQAEPNGTSSKSGLIKSLDPLQTRRSTMDSPGELLVSNIQQQRCSAANRQLDSTDNMVATSTSTSLDLLLVERGSNSTSSRVSFGSKDSQTCLLADHLQKRRK